MSSEWWVSVDDEADPGRVPASGEVEVDGPGRRKSELPSPPGESVAEPGGSLELVSGVPPGLSDDGGVELDTSAVDDDWADVVPSWWFGVVGSELSSSPGWSGGDVCLRTASPEEVSESCGALTRAECVRPADGLKGPEL